MEKLLNLLKSAYNKADQFQVSLIEYLENFYKEFQNLVKQVNTIEYKEIVLLISQTGVLPPTITIVKNNTNANISSTRTNSGLYRVTSDINLFLIDKTVCFITNGNSINPGIVTASRATDSVIEITTIDANALVKDDSLLTDASLTIRVYES